MFFPSIPIKVTLNEYIDIAKDFSTPNSHVFINGVLDKISEKLKKDNKVVKIGRGLL
jgi:transcription antitermination protein NusB